MKSFQTTLLFLSICLLFLSCTNPAAPTNITAEPLLPSEKSRTLTICLDREPESLYYYAAASGAARTVLQAIYDGPVDMRDGEPQPVILESLPSFEDGSASFQPAAVSAGEQVIDSRGNLTALQAGVEIFPSGCTSPDCALAWDGSTELQMDRLVLRFTLKPAILWSDGWPMQADDSVFSYEMASDPATPVDRAYVDRTASYQALDALTVEWTGKPGLVTDAFEVYFWMPLPRHAWGGMVAQELLADEAANRTPLGWGPYVVAEWLEGERILLEKNPNYFKHEEGIPFFEKLVFKITNPQEDTFLANLKFDREPFRQFDLNFEYPTEDNSKPECDLALSREYKGDVLEDIYILENYYQDPALRVFESKKGTSDLLIFNLREEVRGRKNTLIETDLRSILPLCIDRERILREQFFGIYKVPSEIQFTGIIKPNDTGPIQYNPETAGGMLEELGWQDNDGKEETPRESTSGQSLNYLYLVEDEPVSLATAQIVKESMGACGISVNLHIIPREIFWNTASDESIYTGDFDMAQLSWPFPIPNPCLLFGGDFHEPSGSKSPTLNFSGYQNNHFENLCADAEYQSFSGYRMDFMKQMEILVNRDLPALPLYSSNYLVLARNDFCEIQIQAGAKNELQDVELFNYGEDCRE